MNDNFEVQTVSKEQANALREVVAERERQDKKWHVQNWTVLEWIPILLEEFGELGQEVNRHYYGNKGLADYKAELIQVVAVALAMLECLERNGK